MTERYLTNWLGALEAPKDPPFKRDSTFEGESGRLVRLLIVSVLLTAAVEGVDVGINWEQLKKGLEISPLVLKPVAVLGLTAVLYGFFARLFFIKISLTQVFFCFSFVVLPWAPIIAALILVGKLPGMIIILEVAWWGLLVRVLWLIARSISIVSGARMLKVILSLVLLILLMIYPVMKFHG